MAAAATVRTTREAAVGEIFAFAGFDVRLGVLVSDEPRWPEKIEKRELCGRSREISRVAAVELSLSPSAMRRSCQPDLPGGGMQEADIEDVGERPLLGYIG
jgi:hypothetical protein